MGTRETGGTLGPGSEHPESAPARAVLVPPRPNLGPEPLDDHPIPAGVWLALALTLGLSALALVGLRTRARMRRPKPLPAPAAPPDSPRGRMVAWSEEVRAALVARFGAAVRARTTEEIGGDAGLLDALGPERAAALIRFLTAADRAKFAGDADDHSEDWGPWVAGFVAGLSAAGASSTIKGR